jgi:hypothetical protein
VRLLDCFAAEEQRIMLVGDALLELADQAGLADAGVAGEQHNDRALLGGVT